jgi:hypothetical protein
MTTLKKNKTLEELEESRRVSQYKWNDKNPDKIKAYSRTSYNRLKEDPEKLKLRREYERQYNIERKEQRKMLIAEREVQREAERETERIANLTPFEIKLIKEQKEQEEQTEIEIMRRENANIKEEMAIMQHRIIEMIVTNTNSNKQ